MKSLFLLIALYTITGKQAVLSGDIPEGATCTYVQTARNNGQMTAGNTIDLTIAGYDGVTLQSVTLTMKSNKSSGAGELQMKVGGSEVWNIANQVFSSSSWAGKYSTDWVEISHSLDGRLVPKGAAITLHIMASANSLYLQSVKLNYQPAQPQSYTVSFNTHISQDVPSVTESQPNTGIVLPSVELDDPKWGFYGWGEAPCGLISTLPVVHSAGEIYYPARDCVLHAVYAERVEEHPWWPTDDLSQGDYVIALFEPTSGTFLYAYGEVDKGEIAAVHTQKEAEDGWVAMSADVPYDAVYTLSVSHDTLTIRHRATNTPVTLASGGKFGSAQSATNKWIIESVESESDAMPHFVISGMVSSVKYYFTYYGNSSSMTFRPTNSTTREHKLLLYAVNDLVVEEQHYTSFPFGGGVTNQYTDDMPAYKMNVGPYILTIKNGKKYLQINE